MKVFLDTWSVTHLIENCTIQLKHFFSSYNYFCIELHFFSKVIRYITLESCAFLDQVDQYYYISIYFFPILADGITYSFGEMFVQFNEQFNEGKGYTSWIISVMTGMTLCSGNLWKEKSKAFKFQIKLHNITNKEF